MSSTRTSRRRTANTDSDDAAPVVRTPSAARRRRSVVRSAAEADSNSASDKTPKRSLSNKKKQSPVSSISPIKTESIASPDVPPVVTSPTHEVRTNAFRRHVDSIEQPRQLLFAFLLFATIVYIAYTRINIDAAATQGSNPLTDAQQKQISRGHFWSAALAVFLVFCTYCAVQIRDSILIRPHPMLWRITHGIGVLYVLILAAASVQSVSTARSSLQFLFDDIVDKHDDAWNMQKDCSITYTTLHRQITSVWFLSHVLGWFGKMCMLRDWAHCWAQSIFFELMELSLQFLIPDFRECWWDSIFIDTLGANFLGMYLGKLTLNYLNSKSFNWGGKRKNLVQKILVRFTPFSYTSYHWDAFCNFPLFLLNVFTFIVPLLFEILSFFFMILLWIPPSNPLPKLRLILLFFVSFPGFSEYYQYVKSIQERPEEEEEEEEKNKKSRDGQSVAAAKSYPKRMGPNLWLGLLILMLEIFLAIKWSVVPVFDAQGKRERNSYASWMPPASIWVPWSMTIVLFSLWVVLYFGTKESTLKQKAKRLQIQQASSNNTNTDKGDAERTHKTKKMKLLDVLFYVSFLPLLSLCRLWAY